MKTITVVIEGISPLLINRFKENDEIVDAMKKNGKKDYGTPRKQAELTAYADEPRTEKSLLWIPSTWVMGSIATVASDYKIPGSRKSVKSIYGGCIIPTSEKLYFLEKHKLGKVEVDSRPVVIQRARIMRHRARLEKWSFSCDLELDDSLLPVDSMHQLLTDAGRRSGLGDFRPPKGGPFGRFKIISWTVAK
jgi:hypothetical protein